MAPLLIAILAAAAVFLLVKGLTSRGPSLARSRRMDLVTNSAADADAKQARGKQRAGASEVGKKRISALKSRRRNASYKALAVALGLGALTAVIGWSLIGLVGAGGGLVGGFLLPTLVRGQRRKSRQSKITEMLPDLLQTLAGGLRAGQTFMQTLDSAADELGEPFRTELLRTLRELELGVSLEEAFESLRARIEDEDFDLVVDAVLIQRRIGGNLAEVLTNISHTIRERIRIRGEVTALTGQARMSGWVLGLLPFGTGFLLFLTDHDYLTPLFTNRIGIAAIVVAIISELIGMLLIRKIADVRV
jgi:tight adherence protein B